MPEKPLVTTDSTRPLAYIKSVLISLKQTLISGLSSSLIAGAAYGYIVSVHNIYFTPALGVFAGLTGGMGIAARDILSEKEKFDDIPLKDLATYILFGIMSLFLGYTFVYYFVKVPDIHGVFMAPAAAQTIYGFFSNSMGILDITGAILGSICSAAVPILFKEKIRNVIGRLKTNRFY